jgi:hypothetical protein
VQDAEVPPRFCEKEHLISDGRPIEFSMDGGWFIIQNKKGGKGLCEKD